MNDTMHAAAIDETGPPEVLRVREVPMPVLAPDGVMVRVVNAGVQPADAAIRSGWTPPGATLTLPQVLGNEFSGVVVGATAVTYGPGQADRIRKVAPRIDAALDAAGHQNLRTAVELVADRSRVVTIVDMQLANELGCRIVRSRRTADRLEALARRVAAGELMVHIRATYPLAEVARAHRDVETGHGRGKVVLAIGDAQ